ncbi:O-antigen ligase family protein [Fibrivirga algicola]|uniref:O-antigen ligase family protein n=1 Tax=Fibrivirga algicola TaxID=2950420 RepID=A0ABX0QGN1_9BACT|nr:O-antigen ligase family protein [Fibrivirga algicola]ARK10163.1 O-antigen polymerase [Fibrella sp. ES10-3-2-2]NID11389.1 O-antigen ligase family protein [Fibrivirga algicola]
MLDQLTLLTNRWRYNPWLYGVAGLALAVLAGLLIAKLGILGGLLFIALPLGLALLAGILTEPKIGLYVYVNLSFLIGAARFLDGDLQVGLGLDGLLVLTFAGTLLNARRMAWGRLKNPAFFLVVLWVVYVSLSYFNPASPHPPAWFYHARSFALSWLFIAVIVLVNPITRQDVWLLVKTWIVWSILAALWGFKQQYIGLEQAELNWLAAGGARTHILWGQLRSFSFYSDAGQFGSEMAGVTLICLILLMAERRWYYWALYSILILLIFWGFAVSGTRSALFVLIGGFGAFIVLQRKMMPIIHSAIVGIPIFCILYFTHLGDGVYQIYRIRTALHPTKDESFLVRLENQERLRGYLKDLPFGAGIGSSSGAGARFSPWHWASQIPPDSWYVMLWIETGVVGLSLYLFVLAGIILTGIWKVWQLKDPWLTTLMLVLLSEFIGICVVSYSNPILGQFPTSTLVYINSMLFASATRWEQKTVNV